MSKKYKATLIIVPVLIFLFIAVWYLHGTNIAVLNPKGPIAKQERDLIYLALLLSLIVVIPVYTLTIIFAWRYREGNTKAKYSPDLSGNKIAETIWWVIPSGIILVLATITWHATHTLDPFRPISSSNKPLTIQVVALDWKWLFIYPQQNIASVNFFQFPKDTPLNFDITSDAPMNSFWIPQLGSQIYAMPGMSTQLHLVASENGTFHGNSANISGEGFSGMTFIAKASSQNDFKQWVTSIKASPNQLGSATYSELAKPSAYNQPFFYSSAESGLYYTIINKYMVPSNQSTTSSNVQRLTSPTTMSGMGM